MYYEKKRKKTTFLCPGAWNEISLRLCWDVCVSVCVFGWQCIQVDEKKWTPAALWSLFRRFIAVGFTTSEIWYKWVDGPKAVSIFPEVELPQFQVMGYRKRAYIYSLTTGKTQIFFPFYFGLPFTKKNVERVSSRKRIWAPDPIGSRLTSDEVKSLWRLSFVNLWWPIPPPVALFDSEKSWIISLCCCCCFTK